MLYCKSGKLGHKIRESYVCLAGPDYNGNTFCWMGRFIHIAIQFYGNFGDME